MSLPEPTKIDPKLHRKLMDLHHEIEAIQKMMQMFQETAQARLSRVQVDAKSTWMQIKQQTGIDLENVTWEPHPTDALVVPTSMAIRRGMTPTE